MVKDILNQIKRFVRRHIGCFICGIIALIFAIVGINVSKDIDGQLDVANRSLSDIKNNISNYDLMLQNKKVEVVTDEDAVDFKKARYEADLNKVTSYLVDCFEFNSADEYNGKREILMKRLGADHSLFKTMFTEYTPEYANQYNEYAQIDDGQRFTCHIVPKSFVPSLYEMNRDTGVNTYVGTFTCSVFAPSSYSGDFIINGIGKVKDKEFNIDMITICKVDSSGEIISFDVQAVVIG